MPTSGVKLLLFLSSYVPLFLVTCVVDGFAHKLLWIPLVFVSGLSLMGLAVYLKIGCALTKKLITVKDASMKDSETMSYMVTYVLPFMADFDENSHFRNAGLLIVFSVIAVIYMKSSLLQINPVLNLLGFHIFEIQTIGEDRFFLITRRKSIKSGTQIFASQTGDLVLLEGW